MEKTKCQVKVRMPIKKEILKFSIRFKTLKRLLTSRLEGRNVRATKLTKDRLKTCLLLVLLFDLGNHEILISKTQQAYFLH